MLTREEWAVRLIGEGFYIFPIQVGRKTPYSGVGWKQICTRDPSQVREWFRNTPDMNYGVVCDDNHVIIDLDNGEDRKTHRIKAGEQNFRDAENIDAGFPERSLVDATFKVRSPKGGYHLYLKCEHPYRISASSVAPDVDVRTRDGYVLGPGCHTDDLPAENTSEGVYEVVLDRPMAKAPEWLEARLVMVGLSAERSENAGTEAMPLDMPSAIKQAEEVLKQREPAIQGHGGNDHTYATAALLKDLGLSKDKCVEVLLSSEWNERCDPPWEFEELEVVVGNAYRYGNRQIGSKGDALSAIGEASPNPGEAAKGLAEGEHFSAVMQPIGVSAPVSNPLKDIFYEHSDFLARENDYDFLIEDWLPASGVTGLIGRYGSGKSVIMVDLANRIALSKPDSPMQWNEKDIAADWGVLYLCGEDDIGVQRMMQAWTKAHGGHIPDKNRMFIAAGIPSLMSGEEVKRWAETAKSYFGDRKVCVMLDTWQRASSSGSQSDDKDMQLAFANAESLARCLNGCVVASFHPPKNKNDEEVKTVMGSSVIDNSTKGLWHVGEEAGCRYIRTGRIKGAAEGNRYVFDLEIVPLPEVKTKNGKIPTGIVCKRVGGSGGNSQEFERTLERLRSAIGNLIEPILADKAHGKGLTYREVGDEVFAEMQRKADAEPDNVLVRGFHRASNPEEATAMLHKLFSPSTMVDLDDMARLGVEGGKFVLKGQAQF